MSGATPRRIDVSGYAVDVGRGLLESARETIQRTAPAHRYAIVTDDVVGQLYGTTIVDQLGAKASVFSFPAGEEQKTRERWASITDAMLAEGFARDTTVVALGGGVVGDLAGFVAATYMRGVPVVQIPTTLLAMIDASVGGKTGVDVASGKNLVGAFHPPSAVIADLDLLATLPARHWRAGLAEAIKHGVVADAEYFGWIDGALPALASESGSRSPDVEHLVARSVEIKAEVVREDFRERGRRQTLNFGHTIGHAIEAASGYRLLHGEAIAIGMVLECELAQRAGHTAKDTSQRLRDAVHRAQLPSQIPPGIDRRQILRLMTSDKKSRAGVTRYAVPQQIGTMAGATDGWTVEIADEHVRDLLSE